MLPPVAGLALAVLTTIGAPPAAAVSSRCGPAQLPPEGGVIVSPRYPADYQQRVDCKWTVPHPDNGTLIFRLVDLDIEGDQNCDSASCCNHNWLSLSASLHLCGRNISVPEYSPLSGTHHSIKYHISRPSKGRGFKMVYFPCKVGNFRCADDTRCVDAMQRCDHVEDCPDGSDEWDCANKVFDVATFAHNMCQGKDMVPCDQSCTLSDAPCGFLDRCRCYHRLAQRCDGKMDCIFGDDEVSCDSNCLNKLACSSVNGCYTTAERCDGISQCLDHSDEIGCTQPTIPKFECNSGKCIDHFLVCNEEDDCGDGSDENNCFKMTLITAVVSGSVACGLLAILGIYMAIRTYAARNRRHSMSQNILSRSGDDQEPLDEGSLYHMYREPPPSYQEAIMQGASPPPYWNPTRFASAPVHHGESAASQISMPPIQRPRPSSAARSRPKSPRAAAKPEAARDLPSSASDGDAISGDQFYPDNSIGGGGDDSDTTMLELSDNSNAARSSIDLQSSSSCSNLMGLDRRPGAREDQ